MQRLYAMTSKTGKHLTSFILFPMMFFLLLSCPTKREFKQMLNIPVQTTNVENCNNAQNTCIFEQSSSAKEQEKPQYTFLSGFYSTGTHIYPPIRTTRSEQVRRNTDVFIQTSLFICYRKLII